MDCFTQFNDKVFSILTNPTSAAIVAANLSETLAKFKETNVLSPNTLSRFSFEGKPNEEEQCIQCKQLLLNSVVQYAKPMEDFNPQLYCLECAPINGNVVILSTLDSYYKDFNVQCKVCEKFCRIGSDLAGLVEHAIYHCKLRCPNDECDSKRQPFSLSEFLNHVPQCLRSNGSNGKEKQEEDKKDLFDTITTSCPMRFTNSSSFPSVTVSKQSQQKQHCKSAEKHVPRCKQRKFEFDYQLPLMKYENELYVKWTDLTNPIVPTRMEKWKELHRYVEKAQIAFIGNRNYITAKGIRQWLDSSSVYCDETNLDNQVHLKRIKTILAALADASQKTPVKQARLSRTYCSAPAAAPAVDVL